MKIGDLVKYRGNSFDTWVGVIVGETPGWARYKSVQWFNGADGKNEINSCKEKNLVLINENR